MDIVTLAVQTPPVMISTAIFSRIRPILLDKMRCMQMNVMYAVTCGYQFSPGYRNVGIAVTCRCGFQGYICQNWIKLNLYNLQGTCTDTFGSKVVTGNRNVSSTNTSRYDFLRYIFQNKITIIGLDGNEMYAVTYGYQLSPGYRNVSIAATCRYDFQGHIWLI